MENPQQRCHPFQGKAAIFVDYRCFVALLQEWMAHPEMTVGPSPLLPRRPCSCFVRISPSYWPSWHSCPERQEESILFLHTMASAAFAAVALARRHSVLTWRLRREGRKNSDWNLSLHRWVYYQHLE